MKNPWSKFLLGICILLYCPNILWGQCPQQPTAFPTSQPVNCQGAQADLNAVPYFDICQTICIDNTGAGASGQIADLSCAAGGTDANDMFAYIENLYNVLPNYDGSIVFRWVDWPNKDTGAFPPSFSVHAEIDANLAGSGIGVASINCSDGFIFENAICLPPETEGGQFYAVAGTFPTIAEMDPVVDAEAGINLDVNDIAYWVQMVTSDGGEGQICFELSRYKSGYVCGDATSINLSGSSSTVTGSASDCLCESAVNGGIANSVNNLPTPCGVEEPASAWYQIEAPFDCNIISADLTAWGGTDDYNIAILSGVDCPGENSTNPITGAPVFTPGSQLQPGYVVEASECGTAAVTALAMPVGTYWVYVSGKSERPTFTLNVTVNDGSPVAGMADSPDNGGSFCSGDSFTANTTGFDLPNSATGQGILWYGSENVSFNPYNGEGVFLGTGTTNVALTLPSNTGCTPVLYNIKGIVSDDSATPSATCESITTLLSATVYPELGTPSVLNNQCLISVAGRCPNFTVNGTVGTGTQTGTAADDGQSFDFVVSNGLASCDITISETMVCGSTTCTQPNGSAALVCDPNDPFNFYVDVTFTAGSANTYLISSSDGSSVSSSGGTVRIGPFANGNTIDVTLDNTEDPSCNLPLGSFSDNCNPVTCPNLTSVTTSVSGGTCDGDLVTLSAMVDQGSLDIDYEIQWYVNGDPILGANTMNYNYNTEVSQGCSPEIQAFSAEITCLVSSAVPSSMPMMNAPNTLTVYPIPVLGIDFFPDPAGCVVAPVDNCGGLVVNYSPTTNPVPGDPSVTVNYTVSVPNAPAGCAATGSYIVQCSSCGSDAGYSVQAVDNVVCDGETFSVSTGSATLGDGYALGYAVSTTDPYSNLELAVSDAITTGDIVGPLSTTASPSYTNGVDYSAGSYYFTPFVSLDIDNTTTLFTQSGTLNASFGGSTASVTLTIPSFVYCMGVTNFDLSFTANQSSGIGNPIDDVNGILDYNGGTTSDINLSESAYTLDPSGGTVTLIASSTFGANIDYTLTVNYTGSYPFPTICPSCNDVGNASYYELLPAITLALPAQPQTCEGLDFDLTVMNPTANIDGNIFWYDGDPDAGGGLVADPTSVNPTNGQVYWALFRADDDLFCTAKIDVEILTIPLVNLNPIPSQPALCQGDLVDLTLLEPSITTQSGVFTWYRGDPDTDPFAVTLTPSAAANQAPGNGTTYYVIFQPSIGCPNKESITYTVNDSPQLNAVPAQVGCSGDVFDLTIFEADIQGTLTGTFAWYDADPAMGGNLVNTPNSVMPNDGAIYVAVFTDAVTGCSNQIGVGFNFYPEPALNQPATQMICDGTMVDLTALEGDIILTAGVFTWYDADPASGGQVISTPTAITPTDGDVYYTEFVDALTGCSNTTSVMYAVGTIPTLNPVTPTSLCEGDMADLTANENALTTENGTFTWYDADPNAGGQPVANPTMIMPNDGDTFFVVFDNGQCPTMTSISYAVNTSTTLNTLADASFNDGDLVDLTIYNTDFTNEAGSFDWYLGEPNNGGTMITDPSSVTIDMANQYCVLFTNSNNCISTGCINLLVPTNEWLIDGQLSVYPNPTSGNFQVEFASIKSVTVQISVLNILGEEIIRLEKETIANAYQKSINLEQYPSGVYLVNVKADGQSFVQKIVKE